MQNFAPMTLFIVCKPLPQRLPIRRSFKTEDIANLHMRNCVHKPALKAHLSPKKNPTSTTSPYNYTPKFVNDS
ncbi:hypothetical protein CEXT_403831 [Caerostris extrusa]|uniref:Uncharacterized protein n=1 Tax=Caerostris extrusa TaxID=172846 RepID=A0AAV4RQF5_CAEEX|nr:hypothetical protein CEXT_403831 [Caerostris extrusa]